MVECAEAVHEARLPASRGERPGLPVREGDRGNGAAKEGGPGAVQGEEVEAAVAVWDREGSGAADKET